MLAAREMAPRSGRDGAQADQVQQLVRGQRIPVVAREEVDDPARSQHRVDAAALEHHADAPGERGVLGHGIEPEDAHVARDRPPVPLERLDRRRLARPVGPQHDEDLSVLGGQVHIVDRWARAGRAVAHGEA